MMVSRIVPILVSVALGAFTTGVSAMFPAPFSPIQIDVVEYGAPIAWVSRVIPTQFTAWNWVNFSLDLAFWSLVSYLLFYAVLYVRRDLKGSKPESG